MRRSGMTSITLQVRRSVASIAVLLAVPALIGLFGFAEVLSTVYQGIQDGSVMDIQQENVPMRTILKEFLRSLYYCLIGTLVGALPGAGGPVASFLAYGQAKKITKHPSRPFGDGAYEGLVASESANNACIGGAMIPMLTLAVPGDAVTAIILSVFYIHGLQPGPTFLKMGAGHFYEILAGGLIGCVFLLVLGLLVAPRISKVINIPKRIMMPIVAVLCVIGAYACNRRIFDVGLMIFFGVLGFVLRRRQFSTAPVTLGLVLGGMMDSNFRRAVSLASTSETPLKTMFWRPITMVLLVLTLITLLGNMPMIKQWRSGEGKVKN